MSDSRSSTETHPRDPRMEGIDDVLSTLRTGDLAPMKEGLPPTFRMRADAHYVDLLDAPAKGRQVPPVSPIAPAGESDFRQATSDGALVEGGKALARSLAAVANSANFLTEPVSALSRDVTTTLLRAEIWRATCLLQSMRVVRSEIVVCRRRLVVQPLIMRVLQAVEHERRLRGLRLNRQLILSNLTIDADEELLLGALSGVTLATFDLVERAEEQVTLVARSDPGGDFVFSVVQDSVTAPAEWMAAIRDDRPTESPAGHGVLAIRAARRVAQQSSGQLTVAASAHATEIRVTLPRIPAGAL